MEGSKQAYACHNIYISSNPNQHTIVVLWGSVYQGKGNQVCNIYMKYLSPQNEHFIWLPDIVSQSLCGGGIFVSRYCLIK